MNVYMYLAALYCEVCGEKIKEELDAAGQRPEDPDDEGSFDSDDYPKGPYPDGGGEADTPQHCDECCLFLENPLTDEGVHYVREKIHCAARSSIAIKVWKPFYGIDGCGNDGKDYHGRCLGNCSECGGHLKASGRYTPYCPSCSICPECGCPDVDGFSHYEGCAQHVDVAKVTEHRLGHPCSVVLVERHG